MRCTDNKMKFPAELRMLSFTKRGDERGALVALEGGRSVPFDIQRVYYIYATQPDVARGFHAHKRLKQVLIAVSGSVSIRCEYGLKKETILLDSPEKGLYIEGMVWHEMHDFSPDCVLMVLASDYYDEADYVRDYEEFKRAQI